MTHDDYELDEWIEDDDDGDDLLNCPACRKSVHEDTQQCPHCGDWITPVYPSGKWKRTAWLVVALLVVAALLMTAIL